MVPLMITSAASYLTIMPLEPHSLYHKRLAQKGELITHNKDKAVLTLLKLRNVIETDLVTVRPNATLGELVKVISRSKRNIFPVVDTDHSLKGIVLLDDIRQIMFEGYVGTNEESIQKSMLEWLADNPHISKGSVDDF